MLGIVVVVCVAVAIVLLRRTPLPLPRWWEIAPLAVLLQVPAFFWGVMDWAFRVSFVILLFVVWANRSQPGAKLIFAGLLLNTLPIMVYGRMPIGVNMVAWGTGTLLPLGTLLPGSKDIVVEASPLLLLGDILPVQIGSYRAAWSIGDVLLCLGVLRYCWRATAPASATASAS
jgi:hypothetical protein